MSWLYKGPFSFGEVSKARLNTCDPRLIRVCYRAAQTANFSVLCGTRTDEEQHAIYADKKSTLNGVTEFSKHQLKHPINAGKTRSSAVDLMPYIPGVNVWKQRDSWMILAGVVIAAAEEELVSIRWGGDWNMDGKSWNEKFEDLGHFELLTET